MFITFLDPTNDLAFKVIFGTEKNKDILIHFLNDIYSNDDQTIHSPIIDVTFLKTISDPEIAVLRVSTVDVMCTDQAGNIFIVEMQVSRETGFLKRAQYYAARAYLDQRTRDTSKKNKTNHKTKRVDYHNLKEVRFLGITNFIALPKKKSPLCHHVLLDKDTKEHDMKEFTISLIQLPLMRKTNLKTLTTTLERWCYFFKYADRLSVKDAKDIASHDLIFERAFEALDHHGWSRDQLMDYERIEMKKSANQDVFDTAIRKATQEGRVEGREEGREEGEQKAKIEMAKAMLEYGIPLKTVLEKTGLSAETIEEI